MCNFIPVSELVNMPMNWVRHDDARLKGALRYLVSANSSANPIKIVKCGCGKSYMLVDGGHRITVAYQELKRTGKDRKLRVQIQTADFD